MVSGSMWNNLRKCFSIVSIIIGGVATGLDDPFAKIAFAVALGFSNAAIYLKSETENKQQ